MSALKAYCDGYLTRQQFIEAQWRIAERKKKYLCQANATASGDPVSREDALQSDASEEAE
jgi:hypothetical protein